MQSIGLDTDEMVITVDKQYKKVVEDQTFLQFANGQIIYASRDMGQVQNDHLYVRYRNNSKITTAK